MRVRVGGSHRITSGNSVPSLTLTLTSGNSVPSAADCNVPVACAANAFPAALAADCKQLPGVSPPSDRAHARAGPSSLLATEFAVESRVLCPIDRSKAAFSVRPPPAPPVRRAWVTAFAWVRVATVLLDTARAASMTAEERKRRE